MQITARCFHENGTTKTDTQHIFSIELADTMDALTEASFCIGSNHVVSLICAHLNYRAQLLGEQRRNRLLVVASNMIQHQISANPAGKHHLDKRHQQTAIRAIVVSQQALLSQQLLGHAEEVAQ